MKVEAQRRGDPIGARSGRSMVQRIAHDCGSKVSTSRHGALGLVESPGLEVLDGGGEQIAGERAGAR
jgi:hypothetical protein